MPRVGVDLRATEPGFKSHVGRGTGRYAQEVVRFLPEVCPPGLELTFLSGERLRGGALERRFLSSLPAGRESVETQLLFPRRLSRLGVDLCHFFSHGDAPAWGGCRNVVTVLDLIPIKFRHLYERKNESLRYHLARFLELRAIKNCDGIIAISEATKRDLMEILRIPGELIEVTPLAADERFSQVADTTRLEMRKKLGLPPEEKLILYVGGVDPRKNVGFLLEVISSVVSEVPVKLVLVGRHETERFYPEVKRKIEELALAPHLIQLGYFPDESLPALYRAADIFAFPSLYEGFGLPVLEATLAGTPVLAGNNSSMPEVLGSDYPLLLPDGDLEAWRDAVLRLIDRPELGQKALAVSGKAAERFSWRKTAELTCRAWLKFAEDR
jgi:glycosyltransferase involved in cell wall biosynthesis